MYVISEVIAAARRLCASLDAASLLLEETVAEARQHLAERQPKPLPLPDRTEVPQIEESVTNGKAKGRAIR